MAKHVAKTFFKSRTSALLVSVAVIAASQIATSPVQAAAGDDISLYISAPSVQGSHVSGSGVRSENFESIVCPGTAATTTPSGVGTMAWVDNPARTTSGASCSIVTAGDYGGASVAALNSDPTTGGSGSRYLSNGYDDIVFELTAPVKYVGLWWSAGNTDNEVSFYNGTTLLQTVTTSALLTKLAQSTVTAVDSTVYQSASYFGNPRFKPAAPTTPNEPFAYLNLFLSGNYSATKIVIAGGGFELDNIVTSESESGPTGPMVFISSTSGTSPNTQTISWAPTNTSHEVATASATPNQLATLTSPASGGGAISYSVVSTGATGCAVNSTTGALSYTGVGICVVRATAAAVSGSPGYYSASKDVTFTITRSAQTVSWSPTTGLLTSNTPASPSVAATTSGDGAITYTLVGGTSNCSVNSSTGAITVTTVGTCVIRATAAQTANFTAAFADVTFNVSEPAPQAPAAPTIIAPPAVESVEVKSGGSSKTSVVKVRIGERSANAPKSTIRVKLFDFNGKILQELDVPVTAETNELEIPVELGRGSFQVEALAVNSAGVSNTVAAKPRLVKQNFFTVRPTTQRPVLTGSVVGKPVYFAANSAVLSAAAKVQLTKLAEELRANNSRVALTGFTSRWVKGRSAEQTLASRRALAVGNFLKEQGLQNWIYYTGFGSLRDSFSKSQERKVEIRVIN